VKNFKPENFWGIKVMHVRGDIKVNFLWRRVHLFDRAAVTVMLERCLIAKKAEVTKVIQKPTSKWRPLPLTTVDLQMMGSRFLRIDSQKIMKVNTFSVVGDLAIQLLTDLRSRKLSIPKAL
jgi:DNA topoisomerase-3